MTQGEALKRALEALYLAHPRFGVATEKHKQAITAVKAALAQPAQEPVAHVYLFDDDGRPLIAWDNAQGIKIGDKLYTAPPKREWVGLTDEQQEEMYQMTDNIADCRTCYFQGIADAEAAHNIGAKP